jgi:hypothetical protein
MLADTSTTDGTFALPKSEAPAQQQYAIAAITGSKYL